MQRITFNRLSAILFALFILFFVQGCGKKYEARPLETSIAQTAHQYLGTPYVSGGRSPKGFDCSGLVWYVYSQNGIELPKTSYKQARIGRKVKFGELRPGDLLFFTSSRRIDHVGVYVGDGIMIHAPGRGKKVRKAELDQQYYKDHFVVARRVI
jgi:cell wall-associated NlpC family hydrolase